MSIYTTIEEARKRKASDDLILDQIIQANPQKAETFNQALNRGANSTSILNEIMKQNSASNTFDNAQNPETRRNYIKEARDVYTKYYADPVSNLADKSYKFAMDLSKGVFMGERIGEQLYALSNKAETLDKEAWSNYNRIRNQVEEKLQDDTLDIDSKRKLTYFANSINPNITEQAVGNPMDLRSLTTEGVSNILNAIIYGWIPSSKIAIPKMGALKIPGGGIEAYQAAKATGQTALRTALGVGTASLKTGGILAGLETAQTVAEGISKEKPLEESIGQGIKEGLTLGTVAAGLEMGIPFATGFTKVFGKLFKKGTNIEDLEKALNSSIAEADKKVMSSKEIGEELVGEKGVITLREQAAREQRESVIKTAVREAEDVVAPQINPIDVGRRVTSDINNWELAEKQIANKFYSNQDLINISGTPQNYLKSLEDNINALEKVGPANPLRKRLTNWLTTINESSPLGSLGVTDKQLLSVLQKRQPDIFQSSQSKLSVNDLLETKKEIDSIIFRGSSLDNISPQDTRLISLSKSLGEDIKNILKNNTVDESLYNSYLQTLNKYEQYKNTIQDLGKKITKSDNPIKDIFNMSNKQLEALKNTLNPARWVETQAALKRYAIESAKEADGLINTSTLNKNINKLNQNTSLSQNDLLELREFSDLAKYFQDGGRGLTPESVKSLKSILESQSPVIKGAEIEKGISESLREKVLGGGDIVKARTTIDNTVSNIAKIDSPQQFDELIKTLPEDIKKALPARTIVNALNDSFTTIADGSAKFNPFTLKSTLENIGFGKGGKKQIVDKLFKSSPEMLDVVDDLYKQLSIIDVTKTTNPKHLRKVLHTTMGLFYAMKGIGPTAGYHFAAAGLTKGGTKLNPEDLARAMSNFGDDSALPLLVVDNNAEKTLSNISTMLFKLLESGTKAVTKTILDSE